MRLTPFGTGYLGIGVYNFYTSRFKITPELQFCFSGTSVAAQSNSAKTYTVTATQLGGRVLVSADYFISRNWTIGGSAGFGYMHNLLSPAQAAEKLKKESLFPQPELDKVNNYVWDVLSSHMNFHVFIGITRRF